MLDPIKTQQVPFHNIPLEIAFLSQLAGEITLSKVGESPFSRGEQAATTGEISVGQIDSLQETQFLDGYQ